jgi:chemotaxis protein methyltransferase CheR
MTPADEGDCKLLSDVIQERFGLSFAGVRRDILLSRVRPRLTALRLPTLLDYYHFLRCHPDREAEFQRLSCQLTNNETYFFREPQHFAIIAQQVVAALGDTLRTRPLRVLSAGCSSGEEPYSLAIALHDAALELRGIRWEIDACDLNRDRIARAREGVYESGSLRACDAEAVRRHFESQSGGRHRLRDRYRKSVRFFEANLATPGGMIGFPPYDVVLCRNLLIYFDDAGFDRTIRLFARALAPGGWLFLGHSESLIDRSDEFVPTWLEGAMIYRKRLAEAAA